MDWLSKHRATLDCYKKEVRLVRPEEPSVIFRGIRREIAPSLINAMTASKMLRKGCQGYLAFVVDRRQEGTRLEVTRPDPDTLLGYPEWSRLVESHYTISRECTKGPHLNEK